MNDSVGNPSIINIIQDMLGKGEPESKVYATLKELGVSEEQTKNLMLIAQANTFTLLKSEIAKMTNESISKELPEYKENLKQELESFNKEWLDKAIMDINKRLDEKVNVAEQTQLKELKNIGVVINDTKAMQEKQSNDILSLDGKIDAKLIGSTRGLYALRILSFIVGLSLLGFCVYKFIGLGVGTTLDFLLIYLVLIIVSVILMVLALI